jgi:3-isopropylmalate/(R)-2-methylmalate dehydratase small subunit
MKETVLQGKVIKLGDQINTDVISPGRWMREGMEVLRLHTMEAIRPDFYKDVQPGDIIVAGRNFGCGSHRQPATTIMEVLGIQAIVADSIARIYYRNCISAGIPIFGVDGVSEMFQERDDIEIIMDSERVKIKNRTKGGEAEAPPISATMLKVLEAGGVYPLLKQRLAEMEA